MSKLEIRRSILYAIIVLVAAFLINKKLSSLKEDPKKVDFGKQSIKVDYLLIKNEDVKAKIVLSGRIQAKNKVEIFSEVTGKVIDSEKLFKEGVSFNKGELMLKIDDSSMKNSLIASRSTFHSLLTRLLADIKIEYSSDFSLWESYINEFNPEINIIDLPTITNKKEKNFLVANGVYSQFYNIKSMESTLNKYKLYAPYNGIVSNTNFNPEFLVKAGQKIGEFLNPNEFELEAGVSISDLKKIKLNGKVILKSNDIRGEWIGKISRISESVDPITQTFKVYININSNDLYEGMYLYGEIIGQVYNNVYELPKYLLIENKFVYGVKDLKLIKYPIQIIHSSKDSYIVEGLKDNSMIVKHPISGAFEGMHVKIEE